MLKKYHELKNEYNKIDDNYKKERYHNWSQCYPSKEEEKASKLHRDMTDIEGRIKDFVYSLHPKIKNELIKIYKPI